MRHSRIFIWAIPFCYGPASVAIRLVEGLLGRGHNVLLLAEGSVAELATLSGIGFYERQSLEFLQPSAADVFCCICDPDFYRSLPRYQSRLVYLDFLYAIPALSQDSITFTADLYLIENYPGTRQILTEGAILPANPFVIPPLVAIPSKTVIAQPKPASEHKILVTFGGTESDLTKVGLNTHYPVLVLPMIRQAVEACFPGARTQIATSYAACSLLHDFLKERETATPLGHFAFIDALAHADIVITPPGLYTVFEAVRHKRPIVFLPPSNYTQVIHLRHYVELGLAPHEVEWSSLLTGGRGLIPLSLAEKDGVRFVLQAVHAFSTSTSAQSRLYTAVLNQLSRIYAAPEALTRHNAHVLSHLGGDGLFEAIEAIESLT